MAADEMDLGERRLGEDSEQVAFGVVADKGDSTSIFRELLRAKSKGYTPFLTHIGDTTIEAVELAEEMGATVVHPEADQPDIDDLRNALVEVVRALGFGGLIFATETDHRIDFARSAELLNDDRYVAEAVADDESSIPPFPDIMVGIPAYNEEGTIAGVVIDALDVVDCVVVVDDGSSDNTPEKAREAGAVVIEHDTNQGYGAALQTIFDVADRHGAERLVVLDADGQHNPHEMQSLMDRQDEYEANLVIGSRFADDGRTDAPIYRRIGLTAINVLTNLSLGVVRSGSWINDTQSGFRLYSRAMIETLADNGAIGNRMSASTDVLYHAHHNNYEIEETGVEVAYDVDNASNLNPISHGVTLVMNILRTVERDRPITVLGIPGFFSSFIGLGFGYWTFHQYLQTGLFPLGLAVTSTFFALAGIFACFTAIILHSLNHHFASDIR